MTAEPPSLTGLILAGGKSSRMGTDKALLSLGGETLLARAERLLATCGATRIHILGRPDLPQGYADREPFAGPAAAIGGWLSANPDAGQLLVIPVDMPRLTADLVRPLIAAGAARYGDHVLPFTAMAPATPAAPMVRVRDLQSALGVDILPVPAGAEAAFVNVNTPADLAALGTGTV